MTHLAVLLLAFVGYYAYLASHRKDEFELIELIL